MKNLVGIAGCESNINMGKETRGYFTKISV
jgi:hypothetical protein